MTGTDRDERGSAFAIRSAPSRGQPVQNFFHEEDQDERAQDSKEKKHLVR